MSFKFKYHVSFFLALASQVVFPFPEMIRHGYSNCITCHVSPNGGGLVTPYGRALSQEVLSTWHRENESDFLWGLVPSPEWLNLGGDFRYVQTHLDTPDTKTGRFIVMQADIEAAASLGKFSFVATVGKSHEVDPPKFIDNFFSRRHFVLYQASDQIYVRAGKFQRAFGINLPDHLVGTKRGLGWDYGSETYNIEGSWIDEAKDIFITGIFGRPDNRDLDREKGVAVRAGFNLAETHKAGLSYFYGNKTSSERHLAGPYAMLGFRKDLFLLAEVDMVNEHPKGGDPRWGWANYGRLDYEPLQGFHLFVSHDLIKSDLKVGNSLKRTYGGGLQFFPQPHFEFLGSYQKQGNRQISSEDNDFFWLMLHFYL